MVVSFSRKISNCNSGNGSQILILYNFSAAEEWQPLLTYRNSLVHGEGEVPIVTSKRPYTRKRKYGDGSDDEDDDDDPEYR